jgi:hypothetical protein
LLSGNGNLTSWWSTSHDELTVVEFVLAKPTPTRGLARRLWLTVADVAMALVRRGKKGRSAPPSSMEGRREADGWPRNGRGGR